MKSTICALATGMINCAIHIIRVSGDDAFKIVQKISKKKIIKEGFIIQRNLIVDGGKIIDDVLLNTFISPKSYTGEDLIEINCHGGIFIAKKIINVLIKNGCELAKPGEFSERSMLNKKINYQQIEGINNLIFSTNDKAAEIAINSVLGNYSKIMEKLRETVFEIIGNIEVNIDYPEYDDVKVIGPKEIIGILSKVKKKIQKILDDSYNIKPLIEGIKIAIVGAPNVGKSSLLNLLSSQEKAIVSNIEGTTRDIVESDILFNGLKIKLLDTAGIRDTKDKIERLGIQKTYETIKMADVIIHLKTKENEEYKLPNNVDKNKIIEVYNKSDLNKHANKINISVKNNDIKELINAIKNKLNQIDHSNIENVILQSERQFLIVEKIIKLIKEVIIELENDIPLDLCIQKIELILFEFDKFLGKSVEYDKLDEMFRKFCLGK